MTKSIEINVPELTLFFDGQCPFCAAEMQRLSHWNQAGRLAFCDMSKPDFDPSPLGVDLAALNREMHSQTRTGQVLVGVDSLLAAYTLVGRGWLVWPLRVPGLRAVLAMLYRGFARNRYRFSRWLGYRPATNCDSGVCAVGNPFSKE